MEFKLSVISTKAHIDKLYKKCISINSKSFLGFNDYHLTLVSRLAIYKSLIRPVMEYGLPMCTLRKSHVVKLKSAQHKHLCKLLSISTNSSAALILCLMNVENLELRQSILVTKYIYRLLILNQKIENYAPSLLLRKYLDQRPSNTNRICTYIVY